ncbi:uncharacterized protein LOC132051073 [Lycium ferocissimum]|uniref:uncharacterized protein LOC132051073 n=1 Tax=Lycium ferocissimum TaxID=112874 RepID=UPI002814AA64|nr:uncharacterized protein LOC132051073 [Lycium ferocissimum]
MLPLANVTRQLTGKTFNIQMKRSFTKNMDAAPAKFIILSFMQKENAIDTQLPPILMDIPVSSKRKIDDNQKEMKIATPRSYRKLLPAKKHFGAFQKSPRLQEKCRHRS